jgi:hypothetical protein
VFLRNIVSNQYFEAISPQSDVADSQLYTLFAIGKFPIYHPHRAATPLLKNGNGNASYDSSNKLKRYNRRE